MPFTVDIAGKEVLTLNAVVEVLKCVEEKENLFANFPIGTIIQDGGKRKRSVHKFYSSDVQNITYLLLQIEIFIKQHHLGNKLVLDYPELMEVGVTL